MRSGRRRAARGPSYGSWARGPQLLLGLVLAVMIMSLPALPATADPTPSSDPASDVRLARVAGENYVFDIPVTAAFAQLITCDPAKYARFRDFCKTSSEKVGGTTYSVVRTQVSWDKDLIDNGQIAFSRDGLVQGDWWVDLDKNAAGWSDLITQLQKLATVRGTWKHVKLLAVTSPGNTPVSIPIPATELARMRMVDLAKETKKGSYYPDVDVPKDLGGFQAQMLAYGNAGRRDPDFRKNAGSTTVLDLSLDTVQTKAGQEKVYRDQKAVPYFTDQRSSVVLDQAAQFQAEYNAHLGLPSTPALHDGPGSYRSADGKSGSMVQVSQRSQFFGGPANVVEGAGPGTPGDYPRAWMKSETHFRPFFNVDGSYPEVGYGAARSPRNGDWYFIFVPRRDTGEQAKSLAKLTLPITTTVGVASPEGDKAVVTAKTGEPPTGATTGPTIVPAEGQPASAAPSAPGSAPPATEPPSTAPSSAAGCPPVGISDRKRDLYFGETWDPLGDGCFQITVEAQDEFTPSDKAVITGDRVEKYRGYRIRYDIRGSKKYDVSETAKFSCETTDGKKSLPFVLDPPGQGLPSKGEVGAGSSIFSIGCGSGPDGYARVFVELGQAQLGGGRVRWMTKS